MKKVRLETFKYPSQPRYHFPVSVVEDKPEQLMLYSGPGTPVYVGKEDTTVSSHNHNLTFLWPDRYYNAILFWKPDWTFDCYYVNLALPHQWDGELCTYIDLELDVALFPDGTIKILDEDEYEESKILYNYPRELIAKIDQSAREVVQLMERRAFPFDSSLINWRP